MAAGLLLFLFGGIATLLSLQLPIGSLRGPGSGLFPLALGAILMGLAACHLLHLQLSRRASTAKTEAPATPAGDIRRVLLFLGVVGLATALLEPLGYPLVTFLLMAALLELLGLRQRRVSLVIALLAAGASYLLFVKWLQIPLPKGWIGL
jgi:putative tricarboxylic transport membrane protein